MFQSIKTSNINFSEYIISDSELGAITFDAQNRADGYFGAVFSLYYDRKLDCLPNIKKYMHFAIMNNWHAYQNCSQIQREIKANFRDTIYYYGTIECSQYIDRIAPCLHRYINQLLYSGKLYMLNKIKLRII